jgi:hypothetical protein
MAQGEDPEFKPSVQQKKKKKKSKKQSKLDWSSYLQLIHPPRMYLLLAALGD